MKSIVTIALGLLFAGHAMAKDAPAPAVNASDKDSFQTVAEWVRKQMEPGGRYAEVNGSERRTIHERLDEMGKLFESRGAVDQMTLDEKKALLVDQEEINSILGKRDGDRLICTYERPIGSNLPVKSCQTARERDERRRLDRKELDRQQIGKQQRQG